MSSLSSDVIFILMWSGDALHSTITALKFLSIKLFQEIILHRYDALSSLQTKMGSR